MRNYLLRWPNNQVVLVCAKNRQHVGEILDAEEDPGVCEIVRFQAAFALELQPKLPRKPQQELHDPEAWRRREHESRCGDRTHVETFEAPENPMLRPRILRWAGNNGDFVYADLYQAFGGQLTPAEAAAVARWRAATAGAAAQQAAAAAEPWVQITRSGYGRYGSRLQKQMTKEFFPRIHDALKTFDAYERRDELDMGISDDKEEQEEFTREAAVRQLRAAVAADMADPQQEAELESKRAQLFVNAQAGDRDALPHIMAHPITYLYDRHDDEDEIDDEIDDEYEDDDDADDDNDDSE
ncbi:hypothetical protein OEZ86_008684 [Tetradesmus obliquus]|nr:hypothetical protein OEZ86_008684 [Tetradesmus obliquus]